MGVNNAFFIGTLVLSAFIALYLTRLPYVLLSISMMSFTVVMLFCLLTHGNWEMGLFRFEDTVIAVIIGIAISLLIWPNRAGRRLRQNLAAGLEQEREFLTAVLHGYLSPQGETDNTATAWLRVQRALQQNRSTYEAVMLEPGKNPALGEIVYCIIKYQRYIFEAFFSLNSLAKEAPAGKAAQDLSKQISAFGEEAERAFTSLSNGLATAKTPGEFPDLESAYAAILKHMATLKAANYSLEELMHLASLLWQLKTLVNELKALVKPIERPWVQAERVAPRESGPWSIIP